MKKNYRIIAALAASMVMLCACGKEAATETTETTTEATTEATADEAAQSDAQVTADAAAEGTSGSIDVSGLEAVTLNDVDIDSLVKLGDYKGITLDLKKTEVTDADVEDSLKSAYSQNPNMKEVTDRAIESGDTANIDFVGKYADTKEEFQGGAGQGYDLVIGSGSFIDGFEDGLIGVKKGETVDLNLTFPEDYGAADLAGKDVIFTVTVNSIKVADTEPSDEWVKGLGLEDVENMDQFRAHLRAELEADADTQYNEDLKNAAVEMVADNATVDEMPEKLYNRYYIQMVDSLKSYVQQIAYTYGVQVSETEYVQTVMQNNGLTGTPEDYLNDLANQQTKRIMVLQAIANKEGIEVSQETIDKYIQEDYDNYFKSSYNTIDEFKASFDTEDYREQIMAEQVAEFLVENANISE
ncbi:trigger factor [Butyrivibrio sp. VCB2001]|uniref:trigger factor n=1 Tax=Butyrivibrio sp. VCB2001 TaxID=1280667 RepID=UPI00041293CD|nr:trigger factor [Butyrivibrio sp. VCB2001]